MPSLCNRSLTYLPVVLILSVSATSTRGDRAVALTILRSACDNGRTCPNINSTPAGTLVIQGYPATAAETRVAGLDVAPGSHAVCIPLSLVPEIATAPSSPTVRITAAGAVLIAGVQVRDPGMLAELNLPAAETAIEVEADVMPFLEVGAGAQ
jgi:hypothetical protein